MRPLSASFYRKPSVDVAPRLLGKLLIRREGRTILAGRIVETEAYRQDDPASHSYRGRTPRNEVMFGPAGLFYVYFTYGMHFCMNVVTGRNGFGEAVLLRSVEPLCGIEQMAHHRYGRRSLRNHRELRELASGPGRLCQAFGVGRHENGSVVGEVLEIWDDGFRVGRIRRSRRIGVTIGASKLWRFTLRGSRWLSRPS